MLAARVRGAPRAEGWGRPSLTSKNSVDRSAAWLSFLLALGPGGGHLLPSSLASQASHPFEHLLYHQGRYFDFIK